jgi:hypothetical protein
MKRSVSYVLDFCERSFYKKDSYKKLFFAGIMFLSSAPSLSYGSALFERLRATPHHQADTTWTVVGAGPAGIAVVGMLLDVGVDEKAITWVDPEFNVGRMGKYYYNVPGNALAENYITFVNECQTFKEYSSESVDYLRNYYPYEACVLRIVIDALQDITDHLKTRVACHAATMEKLSFEQGEWLITLGARDSESATHTFSSHNVVLATGAHPKVLDYPCSATTLSLDMVLDKNKLKDELQETDTVALVGGSHSAILVLKYLYELQAKRIMNFYWHPISYAYDMGEGNIPDYNGLKGDVADWAFEVLEKKHPETIMRVKNTELARTSWLPLCNKIIYAIGYERNEIPCPGIKPEDLVYNDVTGAVSAEVVPAGGAVPGTAVPSSVLSGDVTGAESAENLVAPRLFGIGIAFPEKIIDPWGKEQHTIGMIDFLEYAQRIVPEWVAANQAGSKSKHLHVFHSVFDIYLVRV